MLLLGLLNNKVCLMGFIEEGCYEIFTSYSLKDRGTMLRRKYYV
jgi:hypothetical protein